MTLPRLDEATKLDQGAYRLVVRPRCGEATISRPTARSREAGLGQPDPERSEREAARRAQVAVRRLVCEHRLVRMWTLTLSASTTAGERPLVVRKVQQFTRRLRKVLPRVKWLAVLEWHPGGHGWHVHMVVDRFVAKVLVADLWGWGFVDTRRITTKGDTTSLGAARRAGQYVAKYLTKRDDSGAPAHVAGDHRYLRPLGMHWTEVECEGEFAHLVALAWHWWPGQIIGWMWWSGDDTSWRGPRVLSLRSG